MSFIQFQTRDTIQFHNLCAEIWVVRQLLLLIINLVKPHYFKLNTLVRSYYKIVLILPLSIIRPQI